MLIFQVASTHIALLVYGTFNASIAAEHMPPEMVFHEGSHVW